MFGTNKRAVFFSADALIALLIIFFVLLIAFLSREETRHESDLPQDVLDVLSDLQVGEADSVYVQNLIALGEITNLNNSLLEQIGEFYVYDIDKARALAEDILSDIDVNENFGVWYGSTLIYSRNSSSYENADNVDTARKLLSGISNGTGVTGYSARAFLSSSQLSKYFYFGGYVGDGNISFIVDYSGNISSAEIEAAINNDFEIFVNGISAGIFSGSSSQTSPVNYTIPIFGFNSGENLVEIKGQNLYSAGGFFRITYFADVSYAQEERYHFPGISGAVNLYDGFYVPGVLDELDIFLHLNSSSETFLLIGNTTVFNGTTNGEQEINIDDADLSALLDYNSLSMQTVPIRLGLENVSFITQTRNVDVISVTDLSGSMAGSLIAEAKEATKQLIDVILNYSNNYVALATYDTWQRSSHSYPLSNDTLALKNEVDSFAIDGYTCICCGILRAINCFDPTVLDEDFNGQTSGANPIGWSLSESNGNIDITSSSLEGDRGVLVQRSSSGDPSMNHYFAPQEDPVSVEFLVRHNSGSGRVRLEIEAADDSFSGSYTNYIIFKMYNGWIRNNAAQVTPYVVGTTYRIRIEVVPGSSNYDLYVNDALVGDNLAVSNTRNNVARVLFRTENNQISYTLDDLEVYLTDEICDTDLNRNKAMVVMSDGAANRACGLDPVSDYDLDGDTSNDDDDHAVQAACDAYNNYGITVHAVGFGGGAEEATLQRIAGCGNGSYYFADVGELSQLYEQIAEDIVSTYSEQTLEITGNLHTQLYPDSYIEYSYNSSVSPFGLIFTLESLFDDESSGSFDVPANAQVLEAEVTSYSGTKWTQTVSLGNSTIYNLSSYGSDYISLGDPFVINLPAYLIGNGTSVVSLTTATGPQNVSGGSDANKIIYTLQKNSTAFSPIVAIAGGCNWNVEFEDGSFVNVTIPSNYNGTDICYYNYLNSGSQIANDNDAFQISVANLLHGLDIDLDGRIDFIFSQEDLQVSLSEVSGIPFTWSSEVQARRWY